MSTFLPTVAVQLEAESAAGVSELLQPGQGQRHAPALVVSVLHGHQPRHRQVGVISPHLAQGSRSPGHLAQCPHLVLQVGQGEGAVIQVGHGPRVHPRQLRHAALDTSLCIILNIYSISTQYIHNINTISPATCS